MSGLAYAGLGVVAAVMLGGFALWLAIRSARKEGGAKAEAVAAKEVASNATAAAEVRAIVGAASADAARERLRQWNRK